MGSKLMGGSGGFLVHVFNSCADVFFVISVGGWKGLSLCANNVTRQLALLRYRQMAHCR